MALNLFDNIFDQFTGQAQPQVPSFATPQAPRTTNYTQPITTTPTAIKTAPVVRNGGFAPGFEGTVDETQSGLFKAIQGGADLFTGITKRLGETVQEDKTRFDTEMSQKRQQFIGDMLAKGKKKEDIFSALDSLKAKGEFDFKPGISESVVGGVGNRMQDMTDTTTRLSQIQDPIARTTAGVLPYAGQTVAGALQPITSALEPFVSPVVQKVIEKTGQTENIQALSEGWNQFEKTNPILAENIAGLLNVGQLAPLPFVKPVAGAIKTGTVETGKAIVRGAEYVAPKVVQGVKTGVNATGEGVGKITKSIVSQQSGLGTPAIESILKNPELQGKIRSGELSGAKTLEEARSSIDALREGYRETGKMYDTVRKSNIPVTKNEAKQVLLSQLESEGLATGGKLNLVDLPVKDRGAITQALKYIDEYGDTMTPQNALSIRQKLDDLINYKSDVGSNGQRIVQGLRTKYDEFLGNKLPGLKDIDAKYAPERQFWESIRKDIYKADGTLKDNALSVVSNITNKGNEARLARMESILPGIGEKVKALKAFDDIQNASGIKVGTYGRAATTGAIALASVPLAIASWVATHPVVVARVLESIGLASQKIKAILAKGKNITKEDATIIQQAIAKTPKSKVESIINNLSYDPKTSKLTSKTLTKNGNTSIRPVAISNKGDVGKVEQNKPIVKPNTIKNESKVDKLLQERLKEEVDGANAYFTKDEGARVISKANRTLKNIYDSKGDINKFFELQTGKKDPFYISDAKNDLHIFLKNQKEIDSYFSKPLSNESKVKPIVSSVTIPEGYFKNAFGEIIKKPSNAKGGFIKIPGTEPSIPQRYYGNKTIPEGVKPKKIIQASSKIKEPSIAQRYYAENTTPELGVKGNVINQTKLPADKLYNTKSLKEIGEGNSSKVYDIGGNKVLKVYKGGTTPKQLYTDLQEAGAVPKVYERGNDYIITEKVKQYSDMSTSEKGIVDKFVADFKKETDLIKSSQSGILRKTGIINPRVNQIQANEFLKKYGWDLSKYDLGKFKWGDIQPRNVGIKNGKPIILDEGIINIKNISKK